MSYRFRDLVIDKIGVVGSGNIGPDIALFFAKAFHADGVPVVVVDVVRRRRRARPRQGRAEDRQGARERRLQAGRPPRGCSAASRSPRTTPQLAGATFVIEAATENLDIKRKIFAQLESLCGPDTDPRLELVAHRTRGDLRRPRRRHAARGRRSFTISSRPSATCSSRSCPGATPTRARTTALMGLYEEIGKIPVLVGGRFGYAVNPVFEGLFLAAALAVEEGLGTVKEVDTAARSALGLGVGPFTAMNLTGGNPITNHSLDVMTSKIGPWFRSPRLMKEAMASGKPWDVPKRDEKVELPPEQETEDRGHDARRVLRPRRARSSTAGSSRSPTSSSASRPASRCARRSHSMNEIGRRPGAGARASRTPPDIPDSRCRSASPSRRAAGRPFRIETVIRHDEGDVAVLTIRRPRVLNALNDEVYEQLAAHAAALRDDREDRRRGDHRVRPEGLRVRRRRGFPRRRSRVPRTARPRRSGRRCRATCSSSSASP